MCPIFLLKILKPLMKKPWSKHAYRECMFEIKNAFLKKILKFDHVVDSISFPVDVHFFQEEVQLVFSILSQILGYDDDKSMTKVIIGFMLRKHLPEPEINQVCVFGVDKFLNTTIHFQLAYFSKLRDFRYQSYLLNMFLCSNVSELHFINIIFFPEVPGKINMFEFVNKIMVEVFKIFFDEKLPGVLDEMKCTLKPSTESCIGDWFLYMEFIVVCFYGYT